MLAELARVTRPQRCTHFWCRTARRTQAQENPGAGWFDPVLKLRQGWEKHGDVFELVG